jgi:hypothetical protein
MAAWQTVKDFFRSKHIQLALVAGICLVAVAYVSKRILPEPMDSLYIKLPALLVVLSETAISFKKKVWYTNVRFWIPAILVVNVSIIVIHLIRM